ncbi:MAG: hypothetical protein QOH70_1377 [Blastocatellia bacterium]|jgi:hypothetical protein|nr:hypothetical protein [Blastocatellia bacterium]
MQTPRDRRLYFSVLSIAILAGFLGYAESRFVPPASAAPTTYIVFNTNDGGAGSLRQAILNANGTPGIDTINFILPQGVVNTIAPFSPLPPITDPLIIDGYSQIGTSQNTDANATNAHLLVEISGVNSPTGPCMSIDTGGGGSTIRGLIINRCRTAGLRIQNDGGNNITGNFIGTDANGKAVSNPNPNGLSINNSSSNVIGGTTPAARNLISGNSSGISILGGSTSNVVSGNLIGTDAAGTGSLPNSTGVAVSAPGNTIGGLTASARNIISGNNSGVTLAAGATLTVVQGNYIGIDATGAARLGNSRGIVTQSSAADNLIGGTVAGARNVISGNGIGVFLSSNAAGLNTRVEGNFIGADPAGAAGIQNGNAVVITSTSTGNVIGGTAAGAGNMIAYNFGGVTVDTQATGNSILANSMFSDQFAIDLNGDGITSNDPGDGDTGPNNLQNYPFLTSASSAGGNTAIGGTLNSTPSTAFRIEFFSNTTLDGSGYGPGETFLGSTTVTTDGSGNAPFTVNTGSATASGKFITATATNNVTGDTSEFCSGVQVNGPETFQFSQPLYRVSENAGSATISVTRVNGGGSGSSVGYRVNTGTAWEGLDFAPTSGTLTFGAGETVKTFNVPIIDDVLFENDEFAIPTLSNPSMGAVIGSLSDVRLYIADREQTMYGVTRFTKLISFEAAAPTTLYSQAPITGLQSGEQILGIDFRPSNGLLYGLGSSSRLYTINTTTAVATQVGVGPFSPGLTQTDCGFDFDPVADRIRVVSFSQNLRLNPDTGIVEGTDTTPAYASGDPNFGATPNVVALGYTNNTAGATSTTAFGIDSSGVLVRLGSPGGTPNSPSSGQLTTVGPLGASSVPNFNSLDILPGNKAFAALSPVSSFSFLYRINLLTGSATQVVNDFSQPNIGGTALFEAVRAISAASNGNIGFASATSSVSEGAGKVQITVNRTGDISGAAAVELTTSDGTAVQTSDYTISFATVFFAPGEASKTVDIFITDDGYSEGNETFTVGLTNPQGGFQIGGIKTNTVTITDNDTAPAVVNPIEGASFFVNQHYVDFLNRAPDTSGFNFWTNEITSCGTNAPCIQLKRINVSAAFFLSIEFQKTGSLVYLTHKATVGSNFPGAAPVPVLYSQFVHDEQALQQGLIFGQPDFEFKLEGNKQAFFADFVSRPQFEVFFAITLTPTQFVDALIANSGATIPAATRAQAIGRFFTANSSDLAARAFALRLVVENPAFAAAEFNRTFVTMEYFGYLRRDPDASGFNFWLNKLNSFNGNFVNADMVKAFITSTEYRQRFGAN